MRLRLVLLPVLLLAGLFTPLRAQTDDHEEEDRRYQERFKTPSPSASPVPVTKESLAAAADRLIRDSQDYASKSTPHWQVRTDDPGVDVAASATLLEGLKTWFGSFWKGRLETTPSAEIGRVYVFGSFHDYNKLLTGGALHGGFRPAGHYNLVTDIVALYIGSIDRRDLPDVLVHEGAHMLVAREVLRGRPTAPWLAEGLATYFESTARTDSGSFETGAVAGRGPKRRLKDFRKLLDGGPAWSVATLLRTDDPKAFCGENAEQQYAASWLLVHALFHADGGKTAGGFARFIGRAAEDPSPEALYAAVGLDAAALTALVVAHQRALDVR